MIQKGNTIQTQEEQLRMYSQQIHENEMQMEQNEIYIAQLSEQLNTNQGLHDAIAEQQNALNEFRLKNEKLQKETALIQQNMAEHS